MFMFNASEDGFQLKSLLITNSKPNEQVHYIECVYMLVHENKPKLI